MEKREDTLREALYKNEEERQRWENYLKEQETAITNLDIFRKKLSVEVMVPFGKKAFIPGRLIHTNDVLVGHFQDYYSKCSAHTATEICKKRVEEAKKYLDKLETEKEFFENKLKRPYLDGVLPNSEQMEIIEEYKEENEKTWREIHRQKIREAKLKEKHEREHAHSQDKSIEEIIQNLEEQEMMDELNEEINELNLESNRETENILSKLMSGEIKLPPSKKRIAHNRADRSEIKEIKEKNGIDLRPPEKSTENLFNAENSDDSDTDTPKEVRLIQEQAEYLPKNERAGFFRYQIQIIDAKIESIRPNDEGALKEKMRLLGIKYCLEELIELNEETPDSDLDVTELVTELCEEDVKPEKQKRRISFALEDQMLEFSKSDTVAQMIPTKSTTDEKSKRDIIQLDEPIFTNDVISSNNTQKRKTIAEKVDDNLKTQNLSDANLVNKILDSSTSHPPNTLHIRFKHSSHSPQYVCSTNTDTPQNPAQLYELFNDSQSELKTETAAEFKSREKSCENAFMDVRSEFLAPRPGEFAPPDTQSKSILKNKSAVEIEKHIEDNKDTKERTCKKKRNNKEPKSDSDYLSAYNKVMSDVFENHMKPDPLPKEKFIDMHTPKKRISRFKQMRSEAQ